MLHHSGIETAAVVRRVATVSAIHARSNAAMRTGRTLISSKKEAGEGIATAAIPRHFLPARDWLGQWLCRIGAAVQFHVSHNDAEIRGLVGVYPTDSPDYRLRPLERLE